MKVGVHTSIAGALENAAHHAKKIGCDTFQMFSANPRGWRTLEIGRQQQRGVRVGRPVASIRARGARSWPLLLAPEVRECE